MDTPDTNSLSAPDAAELPIVYIDNEELGAFVLTGADSLMGHAYTWEDEQVTHLHLQPLHHAFGTHGTALFCHTLPADVSAEFAVVAGTGDEEPKLFIAADGQWKEHSPKLIPARSELYSRSKGILEVNVLADKRVMIVGLGSFGSQIAIELAKAGVGNFALMDFDRVELHNLMRHTCTLNELGRLKTDAITDAILGKNPYARIDRFPININKHLELLRSEVERADIVICATDNNVSRYNLSKALVDAGKIGIFGRAVTRAEGGDVFIYRPDGACYGCLVGAGMFSQAEEEITNEASARQSGRIAAYTSAADADAVVQVGLSSDIEPICNMMVKLTLMELSRGIESGISCLEQELVFNYYLWANRRERRHINWSPMPAAANAPTIMRWYGAYIPADPGCSICGAITLDDGSDIEDMISRLANLDN